MAGTINPHVADISTGTTITQTTLTAGTSVSIAPNTAQGSLDPDSLVVYFQAASSAASNIEPQAGSTYSAIGQGQGATVACPTSEAIIAWGGKGADSARFQRTDGAIDFYNTGNDVLVWAVQRYPG